jgi:hypothetical protein
MARRGACSSPRCDPAPDADGDGGLVVDDVHGVHQRPLIAGERVGVELKHDTAPWPPSSISSIASPEGWVATSASQPNETRRSRPGTLLVGFGRNWQGRP